ncbi:rRNA accumulation- protein [Tilletia horrida]|nr:rRNA accumulation- protein [Tilletia horrida]KAK0566335.1 rRNA accumulation- protein [Tilletia horrida]
MASSSSSTAAGPGDAHEAPPAPVSVQFARGILLRFALWPTLKTAVAEQWGGPDSASKRDFLVGHLVDEYGMPASTPAEASSSSSSTVAAAAAAQAPAELDLDDLADLIQDYVEQEYECLIEDESVLPVARDLVALHRAIFIASHLDAGAEAAKLLDGLEQAASRLRGVQVEVQRQSDYPDDDDDDDKNGPAGSGEDEEDGSEDGEGDVDMQEASASSSRRQQEPQVDEDGFTTVQSGRRRRH